MIRARTSGTALTALTAAVTSWVRIGPGDVRAVDRDGRGGGVGAGDDDGLAGGGGDAAGSSTSMPLLSIHQVIARYWAPVSR